MDVTVVRVLLAAAIILTGVWQQMEIITSLRNTPPLGLHAVAVIYSSGPFDTPETTSPKLARAVRILDAACAQLSFSVGSPGHVVINKSYGCQEPACMLVATDPKSQIYSSTNLPASH
ncbi:hypothetical protein B0H17DRAFT_1221417 [Mycena rosella]|uniref:Uncharacterized protein n=1 Tax=Mycena rosella TaxID=1033263 RepID=A0AAD7B490_MYCRO|nr:hypothetical protein B0H17DRAFT_1221417 [Mycena rosella]